MASQWIQSPELAYSNGQGDGEKQVASPQDTTKEVVTGGGYVPNYNGAAGYSGHNDHWQQSFPQHTTAPAPAPASEPEITDHHGEHPTEHPSPKRRNWLIFGIAVLVAIVAGVAGGVAGWVKVNEAKQAQNCGPGAGSAGGGGGGGGGGDSSPPPPFCPTSANDTTGAKNTIRENSALAVAGYQYGKDNDFTIRLFYQAPNDTIIFSTYIAMYGRWTAPRATSSSVKAMGGTPMAATMIYFSYRDTVAPPTPQLQLYFLSPEANLAGYNWRDVVPGGGDDSINPRGILASPKSSLSALWPYVQYTSNRGDVSEVKESATARAFPNFTSSDVGTGASFLVLPGMVDRGGDENEARFFFRGRDGKIRLHTRAADNGVVSASSGSLDLAIPEGAALAGFTYARGGGGLNTLLLFQDAEKARASGSSANGGIVIVSQTDGSSGTKFSAPTSDPVFASAAVPTSITCLTKGPGVRYDQGYVSMALSTRTELNRCYFQSKEGGIREVHYDGTKWSDRGHLPMP
ncbi:hypothetical protein GGTG_12717 [Gaeumannomyces tritici R3-111a-1]|uniref:Fucose-specific lectin n=1 Tax=Gaeumannomyces tritici (strain R3-111a-1) TaxID=644352 RepID=J3PGT7_GAET3|nr:hypothetical protein GGTG_12717 [Gaeumannomyces tritici R3-111a-1]EJT69834.1 hypothetical protein GGTG_12717 [Gaeumannomyces tritici R3-111a-1]